MHSSITQSRSEKDGKVDGQKYENLLATSTQPISATFHEYDCIGGHARFARVTQTFAELLPPSKSEAKSTFAIVDIRCLFDLYKHKIAILTD